VFAFSPECCSVSSGMTVRLRRNPQFVNDPNGTDEDCEARSVSANLSFTDENGGQLVEVDGGRWADADQPTDMASSTVGLQRADFSIGQTRALTIAGKLPANDECFAVDNNGSRVFFQRDDLRLPGRIITAIVTPRGIRPDQSGNNLPEPTEGRT